MLYQKVCPEVDIECLCDWVCVKNYHTRLHIITSFYILLFDFSIVIKIEIHVM